MANDQHAFLAAVVLTNDLVDEAEAGGWRLSRKLPPLKPGWVRVGCFACVPSLLPIRSGGRSCKGACPWIWDLGNYFEPCDRRSAYIHLSVSPMCPPSRAG